MKNIPLTNFRELGGYKTKEGKRIKEGYLFRGRALQTNDPSIISSIEDLHIDSIFDFRDRDNRIQEPDILIPGAKYYGCGVLESLGESMDKNPIDVREIEKTLEGETWTRNDFKVALETYERMYLEMPFSSGYKPMFDALTRHERIYVHCTGGKDRTGVACMLILWALGASERTILYDYRLSNKYRKKRNVWRIKRVLKMSKKLYSVYYMSKFMFCGKRQFNLTFNAIFSKYNDMYEYFDKTFGISKKTIEDWRNFYLD